MKAWAKMAVILGSTLSIAGAALGVGGWALGGKEYAKQYDLNEMSGSAAKSDSISIMEKTKIEDFTGLQANLQYGDFQILPSGDDSCYLSWRLATRKGKPAAKYEVSNGVLKIRETKADSDYMHVDISFLGEKIAGDETSENGIVLYVPEGKMLENMEVQTEYGDVELHGVGAEEGKIKSADGDVEIWNCSMQKMTLESSLGDVTLKNGMWQDGSISLSDGDLELENTELSGQVTIQNQLGDLSLKLKEDAFLNLQIEAETKLGEVDVPDSFAGQVNKTEDEERFRSTKENAKASLRLTTDDGDIILEND